MNRVFVLLGECFQQMGNHDKAIGYYLKAQDHGEREPRYLVRLVQLLAQAHRYLEAERVLHKAEEQMPLAPE